MRRRAYGDWRFLIGSVASECLQHQKKLFGNHGNSLADEMHLRHWSSRIDRNSTTHPRSPQRARSFDGFTLLLSSGHPRSAMECILTLVTGRDTSETGQLRTHGPSQRRALQGAFALRRRHRGRHQVVTPSQRYSAATAVWAIANSTSVSENVGALPRSA